VLTTCLEEFLKSGIITIDDLFFSTGLINMIYDI
jgi:hypothetical protein